MENYWRNKKVFITGINGFAGANLAEDLIKNGAEVFGLIRNSKTDSYFFFNNLQKDCQIFYGDLNDSTLINRIISEHGIQFVFHLAAQVEVGIGLNNPYLTFETNIRGTYTLLEACRIYGNNIESIVIASSDKAYGSYPVNKMPYQEDYPLNPKYPYDTSKACADLVAQSYTNNVYGLPIVITRFCNLYGPGQLNFSAIIPDAMRSALDFSEFIPRSDGTMIRDFLFIKDVSDLYMVIAKGLSDSPSISGQIFNAGPNDPISMKDLIVKIYSMKNKSDELQKILSVMAGKKTSGEIDYQCMDFQKVLKMFNWSPKIDLDEGLELSLEWYEKYLRAK